MGEPDAPNLSRSPVQFGPYEVDFETGELHKHGLRLNLQEKPLRILQALLEKPGKLVTREELREKLWPKDLYVDFDRNLTIAMNRLRTALSDSAEKPRYVETLPRRGYRFIYPLNGEFLAAPASSLGELKFPIGNENLHQAANPQTVAEHGAAPSRTRSRAWIVGPLALVIPLGLAAWYWYSRPANRPETALRVVPFTSSPGEKAQPAFSPDGNELAYAWRGEKNGHANIYVELVHAGNPLRITNGPADDGGPAWSPDGRYIAFFREGAGYFVVPALGGTERKVAETYYSCCFATYFRNLDWSPDGSFLAVTDLLNPQDPRRSLIEISVETGKKKAIVSQANAFVTNPAYSPDGKTIAFAGGAGFFNHEIYTVPVAGGRPKQLTFDKEGIGGLAWTDDGNHIVFSSGRSGLPGLWKVSASGGTPEYIGAGGADASEPAIARKGNRLAYLVSKINFNVWRAAGPNATAPVGAPAALIVSSGNNSDVDISLDGKKIAFESDRSGENEIWTSNSDGTGQSQLTVGYAAGGPNWSPDGTTIAFDSFRESHGDVFVVSAEGGSPRRLTSEPFENGEPSWSRDGRWVYFSSDRSGRFEIWKMPPSGGPAVQVTKHGGTKPYESLDGRTLFFFGPGGVTRMPAEGGEEAPIPGIETCFNCWRAMAGGIWYVDTRTANYETKYIDLRTGHIRRVSKLDIGIPNPPLPINGAFAVSPDGKWFLYTRRDKVDSDITLLEGFR